LGVEIEDRRSKIKDRRSKIENRDPPFKRLIHFDFSGFCKEHGGCFWQGIKTFYRHSLVKAQKMKKKLKKAEKTFY